MIADLLKTMNGSDIAAAIIIENGSVLFAKNDRDDYYYPVGGGVHIGEKAEEAVVREVYEETGVHYEID